MTDKSISIKPITVILNPIDGPNPEEETLNPHFTRRPPLIMSYPPATKNPMTMPNVLDRDQRKTLEKSQGVYPLSLGRNLLTRVHDTKLSRKVCTLEFKKIIPLSSSTSTSTSQDGDRYRLIMKVNQPNIKHRLCINGSRVLLEEVDVGHNDEIGLHGDKYKYKVFIIEDADDNSNTNINTDNNINIPLQTQPSIESSYSRSTSPNHSQEEHNVQEERKRKRDSEESSDKIQTTARQHILDEVTCSICMEILVQAHVANPCGHIFCKACIDRIPSVQKSRYTSKSCPSCRKEITSLSWVRSYDNIIWNMVLMGEIFGGGPHGEEDLNQFMQRCGKKITDEQMQCIFRKCKKRKVGESDGSDEDVAMIAIAPRAATHSSYIARSVGVPVASHSSSFASPRRARSLPMGSGVRMFSSRASPESPPGVEGSGNPAGTVEDPICLDD